MSHINKSDSFEEIAVIGMAARFPGARDVDEFWENLSLGVESISFFTDEEMETSGITRELYQNPNYVKAKGMMEKVDMFDASFFGFSPREAEIMDPQQRFFLECAWEALETAGYDPGTYKGRIGVFAGCGMNTYVFNVLSSAAVMDMVGPFQVMIANDKDFLPTIVSYKLNLKGPSVNVQTACSTSLVAIHLACQSLLNGECDIALAGGVSISSPQRHGYLYIEGDIHSPDGHCRAFDAKAKGTLDGDGVGLVVLKRLESAVEDRDRLCAIIKGSGINNDGSNKVGYTAPSEDGQALVIAETLALAGIEPEEIGYVEGHGTGTLLGDPIEVAALTQVFRSKTPRKNFCALGSLKSNVGHLGSAAGVAGLIKAVLCLQHRKIPPTLHFEQPNPAIDLASSPFFVNNKLIDWPADHVPRRAAVSSFGIGGTNAHAVLEEAVSGENSARSRPWQLLLLSARTAAALEQISANLVAHLQKSNAASFPDIAYTQQIGRKRFDCRRAVVCQNAEDAIASLARNDAEQVLTVQSDADSAAVVFMFPGGGAQYLNMGLDLYRDEPVFREEIDLCAELLQPMLDCDIREAIFSLPSESATNKLKQTDFGLPALFAVEYAMAKLWMTWGIHASAMIGHSLGEYAAACLAGVFSLPDALALVAFRGRLFAPLPPGGMLSVSLAEDELRPLISEDLSVAAINGPSRCVVSGSAESVDKCSKFLAGRGIECHSLYIGVAAHSQMVDTILEPFQRFFEKVHLQPPAIPFISNVSGTWITAEQATSPEYWTRHLRQTVRFRDGIEELLKDPGHVFLEVGPGHTLSALLKLQTGFSPSRISLSSLRHPFDGTPDLQFLLKSLGELWLCGARIDWEAFYRDEHRRREVLPTYPFERQRYWIEKGSDTRVYDAGKKSARISKRQDIADWFYVLTWKESALPPVRNPPGLDASSSPVIVFSGEHDLGRRFGDQLRGTGHHVITVLAGDRFSKVDETTYTFAPAQHQDYADLIGEILSVAAPRAIVNFWNVGAGEHGSHYDRGFYSLLFLAQALAKKASFNPLKILVVTTNLQNVTGEETICPEKATILGPCEVIPQEYPNVRCQVVDVTVPPSGTLQEQRLLEVLRSELNAETCDHVVAYRNAHRWVQVFSQTKVESSDPTKLPWKERGVYLITGGLGNVGLALAGYLARKFHARLILAGRSPFPPREEWEGLAGISAGEEKVQRQIRKLLEIEQLGADVRVVEADVADLSQTQAAVRFALEQFGTINGVIHAAGMIGNEMATMILEATTAGCEQQFHPKIAGALALEQSLRGIDTDFVVLISSLSSIIGGLGFSAYSSANAFLDSFVHHFEGKSKVRWVSIGSDIWQFGAQSTSTQTWAQLPMSPEQGVEAIERALLLDGYSRVIISTGDLQARIDQWINFEPLQPPIGDEITQLARNYSRPNLRNAYVPPQNDVERVVVSILETCLGIDVIGIHDNFFDLGGQSLLATRVVSALRDAFQVEISLRALFEKPTAAAMAKTIEMISTENHVEVATIARLIVEISSLSTQEAKTKLAAKRGS